MFKMLKDAVNALTVTLADTDLVYHLSGSGYKENLKAAQAIDWTDDEKRRILLLVEVHGWDTVSACRSVYHVRLGWQGTLEGGRR